MNRNEELEQFVNIDDEEFSTGVQVFYDSDGNEHVKSLNTGQLLY